FGNKGNCDEWAKATNYKMLKKSGGNIDLKSLYGYRAGSPFINSPYLDIKTPEGLIDMSQTPFDLVGTDNLGNKKLMKAGNKSPYRFAGNVVREVPMATGGLIANATIHGKKLPPKQRKLFKAICKGEKMQQGGIAPQADSLALHNAFANSQQYFNDVTAPQLQQNP